MENGKTMIYNFWTMNRHLVNKKIVNDIGRAAGWIYHVNVVVFVFFNLPLEKCKNKEGKMEYMTGYEIELLHGNGMDRYLTFVKSKMIYHYVTTMDHFKPLITKEMQNMK